MIIRNKFVLSSILFIITSATCISQEVPSQDEKIPYIATFSKRADKNWGDDDHVQVFFFVVPETNKTPVFIRIFDADNGGTIDENRSGFNSKTRFTVIGGKGAYSDPNSRSKDATDNYKAGFELASRTFGNDPVLDAKWYTMGPFNPLEGELQPTVGGRVFKMVIEGLEGDDGNLYRFFLSSSNTENKQIEGGSIFAYEYSLRLFDTDGSISHLYPYVTSNTIAVKINVFDFDNDGTIKVVSAAKKGEVEDTKKSIDGTWMINDHKIVPEEVNTSLDVQFIKQGGAKNNNIVVYITNQYGELLPLYTVPVGGMPKYKIKIRVRPSGYQ